MIRHQTRLNDLLGSRICHDLISPIGAIGNGIELLAMSGATTGAEMELISESVENANARIRYFRIAFGAAGSGQDIARSEAVAVLSEMFRDSRMHVAWLPETDLPRSRVKLNFLLFLCFESALPRGGAVSLSSVGDGTAIYAEADMLRFDENLWALLADAGRQSPPLAPATVHFALAGLCAQDLGLTLSVERSQNSLRVRY